METLINTLVRNKSQEHSLRTILILFQEKNSDGQRGTLKTIGIKSSGVRKWEMRSKLAFPGTDAHGFEKLITLWIEAICLESRTRILWSENGNGDLDGCRVLFLNEPPCFFETLVENLKNVSAGDVVIIENPSFTPSEFRTHSAANDLLADDGQDKLLSDVTRCEEGTPSL